MFEMIASPVKVAHLLMGNKIGPGATVIDATVGNGYDTLFLAEAVGVVGRVYGFDIQAEAIENTKLRLLKEGLLERVLLFHEGHENLAHRVTENIDGIMFNLGYLPGGDHRVITKPSTTIMALEGALKLLKPGGLATVVVYPGHEGGADEAQALDEYVAHLPKNTYSCVKITFVNRSRRSPYVLAIEKAQ
ncbi:putative rRNA methylase [Thermincola ferriacetica]|uniref:Putative rRNA methylase n=1 Tax=Thermincola ferriacetica TaxID=281456 RepID=A0A0L6W5J7_9FIRM|nr:class I SAM-dependent methyltransferase [Thermincola ferriacetica]KNZ70741.1 putative rRNA methylase [Thermincola ferriacetica]